MGRYRISIVVLLLCCATLKLAADQTLIGWEFNRDGDAETWYPEHSLSSFVVEGGILKTRATAGDPYMIASRGHSCEIDANDFQYLEIRMKSNKDGGAEFFWANTTEGKDLGFVGGQERGFEVTGDGEFHVYRVFPVWEGHISRLRFDPSEEARIEIDYLRIAQLPPTKHDPTSPRWDFRKDAAGGFVPMSGCEYAAQTQGLKVTLTSASASLVGPVVDLKSQDHAFATLHLTSPQPMEAVLMWSDTTNANFPGCNAIPFEIGAGEDYLTLPLSDTAMWTGAVKRLQLMLTGKAGQSVTLHGLSFGKLPEGPAKLTIASMSAKHSIYSVGEEVLLTAQTRNDGGTRAQNVSFRFTAGNASAVLASEELLTLADLQPGATSSVSWKVRAAKAGVVPLTVRATADGILRPVEETTELIITQPIPEIKQGRLPFAVVKGAVALVGNNRLRLAFIRDDTGFQRARIEVSQGLGTGEMVPVGYLPHLVSVAFDSDPSLASVPLAAVRSQADSKSASLRMKGSLGPIQAEVLYSAQAGNPWIDVTYRLTASREVALKAIQGPWLWAGEGSFGEDQDHALFPGVEWLIKGERSSSTLDVAPPMNVRWAPHPNWITVPSMAVEKDGNVVGLMWDPLQKWDGVHTKPAAVFASPNFVEKRRNHLMGLFLPSIPEYVEKNSLRAKKPYMLKPGKTLTLRASIFALSHTEVTSAVTTWYERFCGKERKENQPAVPSLPPKPRDYRATIDMSMQSYEKLLWKPEAKGWSGVLGWAPGRDLGTAALYDTAAQVRHDSPEAIAWQGKALGVAEEGNDLTFALRGHGRPDSSLRSLLSRGQGEAESQPEGARYTFQPDEQRKSLGPTGGTAVGIAAGPVGSLLSIALRTGDGKALAAGLKGLAFMDRFDVPRASQVWECPLHEPDILASGQACRAYLMGYRLTGERKYLDRAIFWARTGLPFLYAWQDPKMPPLMKYASIPVFGTSFYTGLWFGRPVQWNGLDYASSLLDLAPYDKSFPWRHIGEGVTISGMNQQATRPEHNGLYTDNWDVTTNTECVGCMLGPGGILSNIFKMLDVPPQAGVEGVVTPEGWIAVNGPGNVSEVTLSKQELTAKLTYAAGAFGYAAVMPIAKPASVSLAGSPMEFVEAIAPKEGQWTYDPQLGCVTVGLRFQKAPVMLMLSGVVRKEPEYAEADWKFDVPGDALGWVAANNLSAPSVRDGVLRMEITGGDPYFVSPVINVPTEKAKGIALRARVSQPNGEFFWGTSFGPLSPQREVSFTLPADGQFHEVFVDLTTHPEWRGILRQLRVDFAGSKGDTTEVEWVRVVRR